MASPELPGFDDAVRRGAGLAAEAVARLVGVALLPLTIVHDVEQQAAKRADIARDFFRNQCSGSDRKGL